MERRIEEQNVGSDASLRRKKSSVIWYDKERGKFRVAMGKRKNTHIGRFATLPEALAISAVVDKAYEIGYEAAMEEYEQELSFLRQRELKLCNLEALGLDKGISANDRWELDY